MYSLSERDLCTLAEYVQDNEDSNVPSEKTAPLLSFISESNKLSERVCNQQSQEIEVQIDQLYREGLSSQPQYLGSLEMKTALNVASVPAALNEHELDGEAPQIPLSMPAYDQPELFLPNESTSSSIDSSLQKLARFSSHGQARTGSHHGRGGRRKGSGFQVRQNYAAYAASVISKRMMELMTMNECHAFKDLVRELLSNQTIQESFPNALEKFKGRFLTVLRENVRSHPYTIQQLPLCVIGVSAKFSTSDSVFANDTKVEGSMSRHIANTWIDCNGGLRCTCLGSTQYSILARNCEFSTPSCEHTQAFFDIFESIGESVFGSTCLSTSLIFKTASTAVPDLVSPLKDCFPFFRYIHRNHSIIYIYEDAEIESERCWVPIRCVQRKGMKFLCAFCDSIATNACHHVKSFSALRTDPSSSGRQVPLEDGEEFDAQPEIDPATTLGVRSGSISHLPVAPVNCKMALRTELSICQHVREKKTYILSAPDRCIYCGEHPHEGSEKTNKSGIVMCSLGACRLEVQTLQCGNCNRRYSAEGRKEGLFLESICSAATHVLIRHELIGFALGNGTLNSRLNQLHSHFAALEDSSVFSNVVPCLSTKTMFRMCTRFARLTVIDPPEELFWCSTCQTKSNQVTSTPKLLCTDGIWAGYLRKSKKAFENLTFDPTNLEEGVGTPKLLARAQFRPRTSLVRLERAVSFLLLAIKGEKIEINTNSLNAAIAAVRIISSSTLPEDFYHTSVCGRTAADFDFDKGSGPLQKIQVLTSAIFDERTLLYRLLCAILSFFQGISKKRKSKKGSKQPIPLGDLLCDSSGPQLQKKEPARGKRKKTMDPDFCCTILSRALQLSPFGADHSDSVPWNSSISEVMRTDDVGKQVFNLYRSLLQGPTTHLFRKDQLGSARLLAESCVKDTPEGFMKAVVTKERYTVVGTDSTSTSPDHARSNIIEDNRILLSGLFSAAVVDSWMQPSPSHLLHLFGVVILESISVVASFYEFYDAGLSDMYESSVTSEYVKEWGGKNRKTLLEKMKKLHDINSSRQGCNIDYGDVYTTGTFFPSFPQVRPLLFNDEGKKGSDTDLYGICSKHYLQMKGSFTPGAVTFCCGCAHPIVLGFKVLEWDEGPRAILDILVSRFSSFPRYLIYDFACGIYKSAVHSLWWAVGDSTLVSDAFHGSNHKCSPYFKKPAHKPLDMCNTVSHEQRNRPIAKIKISLQQTSQDTYISLLAFQVIVNNLSAKARTIDLTQGPVQNRSASDLEWAYFNRLKLTCPCCSSSQH